MLFYTKLSVLQLSCCCMLRICWTHHHVTVCWSHAVLVLVLTLLACISCRLPTLHLVDNDEFVKKIWKEKSYLWLLSLFFTYLNINVWRLSCRLEVRDANQKAPNTCEGWSHFRTSSCLIPDFDWLVGWIWVKCLPSGIASLLLGYSTVVRIDIIKFYQTHTTGLSTGSYKWKNFFSPTKSIFADFHFLSREKRDIM